MSKKKNTKSKPPPKSSGTNANAAPAGSAHTPQENADAFAVERKHPRVNLDFIVQMKSASVEEFKIVHGKNLSVGGMFMETATPRPIGAQVFFQFTVKDGGTLIEGLGKVVHVSAYGMGLEFVNVLEPSKSIIRSLVEQRMRGAG